MKTRRFLTILAAVLMLCLVFTSCDLINGGKNPGAAHFCPECGKCLDADCTLETCVEKCEGHHFCITCGLCADEECTEETCTEKCPGHEEPAHECEHACPECGKCIHYVCEEDACTEKCEGHEEAPATSAEETFAIVASAGTLSSSKTSVSWSSANFNFVAEKGTNNNNPRVTDTDHFRIYQGNNFSITGKAGEKITKVVFTALNASYAEVLATSLNANNGYTATVNGSTVTLVIANGTTSVTFTTTAQTRINNIVVTYEK